MAEKQTQTPSSSPSLEGPLLVEPLRSEPAVTPAQVCGQRGTCLFPRLTRPPPHPTHSRWSAVRPRCKRDYSVYIFFKERKQNTPPFFSVPCSETKPVKENRTQGRLSQEVGAQQPARGDDGSAALETSGVRGCFCLSMRWKNTHSRAGCQGPREGSRPPSSPQTSEVNIPKGRASLKHGVLS